MWIYEVGGEEDEDKNKWIDPCVTEGEVDPSAEEASDFPSLLSTRRFATIGWSLWFQSALCGLSDASVKKILRGKAEESRKLLG